MVALPILVIALEVPFADVSDELMVDRVAEPDIVGELESGAEPEMVDSETDIDESVETLALPERAEEDAGRELILADAVGGRLDALMVVSADVSCEEEAGSEGFPACAQQ